MTVKISSDPLISDGATTTTEQNHVVESSDDDDVLFIFDLNDNEDLSIDSSDYDDDDDDDDNSTILSSSQQDETDQCSISSTLEFQLTFLQDYELMRSRRLGQTDVDDTIATQRIRNRLENRIRKVQMLVSSMEGDSLRLNRSRVPRIQPRTFEPIDVVDDSEGFVADDVVEFEICAFAKLKDYLM